MKHQVKATREGLIGHVTAAGLIIRPDSIFVALPSIQALWSIVRVSRQTPEGNKRNIYAPVLDVGPWNEHDNDYVYGNSSPASESGIDEQGRHTNCAGIDLSEGVCRALGWADKQGSGEVEWEFIDD